MGLGGAVDPIHPRFARAHPVFYDTPERAPGGHGDVPFTVAWSADWELWSTITDGAWTYRVLPGTALPAQGWKVHISATPESAAEILERVSTVCHARGLPFKHLNTVGTLKAANSKDADRSSAGKFITVYPSQARLEAVLNELDSVVSHLPGPYILSDMRWRSGPVYVRYGAFTRHTVDVDGVPMLALRHPDGHLVPDIRSPQFVVPEWVRVPPFIESQRAALDTERVPEDFPTITRALHHSNAGGVYEAVDHDGSPSVLKEARPHAGLTPDGADAPARLRREAQVLKALSPLACVVKVRRELEVLGHRFLVTDRVPGRSLQDAALESYPSIKSRPTTEQLRTYRDWALMVMEKVAEAVAQVHEAGYSHGDLHPRNIMVTDDGGVALIDFEMAQAITDHTPTMLGAPGFVPPDPRGGTALDLWAVACIRLFLFAPLTSLVNLDECKAVDLAEWADRTFDLGSSWVSNMTASLRYTGSSPTSVPVDGTVRSTDVVDTDALIADICEALTRDATLERLDRAWPGDPEQFAESPAGLAHGAGGILLALHAAGAEAPDGSREWFEAAAERLISTEQPALGLMDGLSGIMWARHALGDHAGTARARSRLLDCDIASLGPGIYRGSSGIGLTLLETDSEVALDACRRIAGRLTTTLAALEPPDRQSATGQAGLMRGWAGAALFGLRLFERTGESEHLQLAERALERDLATCRRTPDGSVQVDEGWRLVPYLGTGATGIGLAINELERVRPRDGSRALLEGMISAASPAFVVYSGLLQGRAGLVHFLLSRVGAVEAAASVEMVEEQIRLLSLHAIRRPHGIAFPGHGLLRLSCDLATGSAGVLSALCAYKDCTLGSATLGPSASAVLPFLTSPRPRESAPAPARPVGGGDSLGLHPLAPGTRTA